MAGANGDGKATGTGLLGTLLELLVAEKSGFQPADDNTLGGLREFADRMAREAMASVEQGAPARGEPVAVTPARREGNGA